MSGDPTIAAEDALKTMDCHVSARDLTRKILLIYHQPQFCLPQPGYENIILRRWNGSRLSDEAKSVQLAYCNMIANQASRKDVQEIIQGKRDELKVLRDKVTGYRVGEWPGGF
jgi:hypothetical protein